MRGIIIIGGLGAAAYYLAKSGNLPQALPAVEAVEDWAAPLLRQASFVSPDEYDAPARERAEQAAEIKAASGGHILPILGPDEVVTMNKYEAALRRNSADVSAWAMRNIGWAAAILKTENGPINPKLAGDNGTSFGVGQVKVATAETCARSGYTKYAPTRANLETMAGGIYFATAEMERLSKINSDLDWIIQAYNGGAGFEKMNAKYRQDRAAYLTKVKRNFASLYSGSMA